MFCIIHPFIWPCISQADFSLSNTIDFFSSYFTGASKLYGGDLEAVVNILKAVLNRLQYLLQTKSGSFYNKESFLQEIYQNVLRTGSNLMANQSLPAWRDLSRSRRIKVASNLLQILQQHAFLLLGVIQEPELITESTPQIGMKFKFRFSNFVGRQNSNVLK